MPVVLGLLLAQLELQTLRRDAVRAVRRQDAILQLRHAKDQVVTWLAEVEDLDLARAVFELRSDSIFLFVSACAYWQVDLDIVTLLVVGILGDRGEFFLHLTCLSLC